MFLLHYPQGHPHWPLTSIPLYGVRTFLGPACASPRLPVLLKPACIQGTIPAQVHIPRLTLRR